MNKVPCEPDTAQSQNQLSDLSKRVAQQDVVIREVVAANRNMADALQELSKIQKVQSELIRHLALKLEGKCKK